MMIPAKLRRLIQLSITEDLGRGDITTDSTIDAGTIGHGFVKAKSRGILCGQAVFSEVFSLVDPAVTLKWTREDGTLLQPSEQCVTFEGPMRSILIAERTALNFIQRMSGVATLTESFVQKVCHTKAQIIDTRKTTPLWREFEKYAVRCGGGANHRMGLYDMFLIKDNHITGAGGISNAIQKAIEYNTKNDLHSNIEVETKDLDEVQEALRFPIQRIMLDNMKPDLMKEAVKLINGRVEVEASGNVSLNTVAAIAETGVDYISVGALTHSAPALDLSLLVE